MDRNSDKARKIISANRYMTLATSSDGSPWAAPVAYVIDSEFNFYWYSESQARHSQHIAQSATVAVAIFDSTAPSDEVDGLQIEGVASEVPEQDLERIMNLYYERSFPDPEVRARWQKVKSDFMGDSSQRFYRFTPMKSFKCDLDNTSVDRRVEVSLKAV